MPDNFQQVLAQIEFLAGYSQSWLLLISIASLLSIGGILYFLSKHYIMPLVRHILSIFKPELAASIKSPLLKMTERLAWLAPVIFILMSFGWFVQAESLLLALLSKVLFVYFYINVALVLTCVLNIGAIIYNQQSYADEIPIKGILQIVKLAIFIVFGALIIAEIMDKTAIYLLSSLGALTAVLLLIFKDTILGLVAGIQIATHRLVAHGDWIEMPQYGADGNVMEVGLHTVRVRNWDNTITTIPTYKLISDSFKNWRGMAQSEGRRIKRSLHIDIGSVTFIDQPQTDRVLAVLDCPTFTDSLLADEHPCETNLGLFRRYCEHYLRQNQQINQQLTLMARQLQADENGIGIEIYCFCKDKRWVNYEQIQAKIIEHLIAHMPTFDLHIFQRPTGEDFQSLRR